MALADNLISYWKLDESSGDAADSVASNTLVNVLVTYIAAKINNGALYNSAGDGLSIADASQAGLDITGDISVSFWIKHTTLPPTDGSADQYYIDKRKIVTNGQYTFGYTGNYLATGKRNLYCAIRDASNNLTRFITTDAANVTLSTVAFNHVVFAVTAATPAIAIYVDGSSIGTQTDGTAATAIGNNDGPFTVGYAISPGTVELDGLIDEIGIWSRVLTSGEVSELYNSGAGNQYPFTAAAAANHWLLMGV